MATASRRVQKLQITLKGNKLSWYLIVVLQYGKHHDQFLCLRKIIRITSILRTFIQPGHVWKVSNDMYGLDTSWYLIVAFGYWLLVLSKCKFLQFRYNELVYNCVLKFTTFLLENQQQVLFLMPRNAAQQSLHR